MLLSTVCRLIFSDFSASKARSVLLTGSTSLADRGLDGVELADLGVGVEQQIAQRLVVAADLGAERGEQFLVELERIVGQARRRSATWARSGVDASAGLRARKPPNLLIEVILLAPIRPAEATPNHLCI